jgi:hypothetical protein
LRRYTVKAYEDREQYREGERRFENGGSCIMSLIARYLKIQIYKTTGC